MSTTKGKYGVTPQSAVLSKNGYLRLSSDLLPVDVDKRKISFLLTSFPDKKELALRPVENGASGPGLKRKAIFSNKTASSPQISVRISLKNMGVLLPKKSVEYTVKKQKDGTLRVKF